MEKQPFCLEMTVWYIDIKCTDLFITKLENYTREQQSKMKNLKLVVFQ